ncbi:MAG: hypothetical protein KF730_17110 [Sphingomonas sp.]|uniref:hypothetical protein n=1 Tax=Sphingomonas sp. TaxID=28214 RepID=UPI0025EC3A0E|nr:hypothetical protein [Sphingomonas sp.]MBX3566283.1 hypothetical protein [Sphingomonas sp.]
MLEILALGNGAWKYNGTRVNEARLFAYLRRINGLSPTPQLVVDLKIRDRAQKRRLKIAIAEAARCVPDFPMCVEGTRQEYSAAIGGRS